MRVTIDNGALRELTTPVIESAAERIATAAGKGFEASVQQGKTRPHGVVKAATFKARRDNARHNALLKALNAGRV
jgi:hypothetical protein|nr:MAG TPA: type I neck protein [Caudoviricetes sp.]